MARPIRCTSLAAPFGGVGRLPPAEGPGGRRLTAKSRDPGGRVAGSTEGLAGGRSREGSSRPLASCRGRPARRAVARGRRTRRAPLRPGGAAGEFGPLRRPGLELCPPLRQSEPLSDPAPAAGGCTAFRRPRGAVREVQRAMLRVEERVTCYCCHTAILFATPERNGERIIVCSLACVEWVDEASLFELAACACERAVSRHSRRRALTTRGLQTCGRENILTAYKAACVSGDAPV